jgi:hypothetical protein
MRVGPHPHALRLVSLRSLAAAAGARILRTVSVTPPAPLLTSDFCLLTYDVIAYTTMLTANLVLSSRWNRLFRQS